MTEYLCEANAPLLWPTVYLMTMAGVVIAATFAVLAALLDKANNRLPVAMLQTLAVIAGNTGVALVLLAAIYVWVSIAAILLAPTLWREMATLIGGAICS